VKVGSFGSFPTPRELEYDVVEKPCYPFEGERGIIRCREMMMMLIVVEKRRKGKGDLKTRHWLAIHIKKGRKEKEWKKIHHIQT